MIKRVNESAENITVLMERIKALPASGYGKFFDGNTAFVNAPIKTFDLGAIPPKDRPATLRLLIEVMAVQTEKHRRKVRFLPAQVIRRIKANMSSMKIDSWQSLPEISK